jgi:uncharacterized membrane protein
MMRNDVAIAGRVARASAGRAAIAAAVVAAAALATAVVAGAPSAVAALIAWSAGACVFVLSIWLTVAPGDTARAERFARADAHAASEVGVIAAGLASLIAVGFVLAGSGDEAPLRRGVLTALAVVSVVLAWAVVHTIYAVRYARLFFTPPVGGIDFPQPEPPDALDFLYVALTIGMTFQVSDTSLGKRAIRRAAIHHALLSYLFGSVILAITVSSVTSILRAG